jgi:glucuronoarabinoxylan endo-1,4-beta-xylanase
MTITRRGFLKTASGVAVGACSVRLFADAKPGMAGIAYTGEHVRQQIDGFGFSEAFHQAGVMRMLSEQDQAALLNLMFSPAGGMGYSILRNSIGGAPEHPDPKTGEVASIEPEKGKFNWTGDEDQIWLMNEAKKRGCTRFFSSCWSPPAWMKTNNDIWDGSLKPAMYQEFADYLASYVLEYKSRYGLEISAISPTNEPNFTPTQHYSSCRWTSDQLSKFLRENLIPTFAAKGVTADIVIDEHEHWTDDGINTILSDSVNAKAIKIVASHAYAPTTAPYVSIGARTGYFNTALSMGKRIWETEVSAGDAQILNMNDGVYWARVIHSHMVENNVSAWLYWWGAAVSKGRSSLITIDTETKKYQLTKRFFTIGQFSRFIRPGYHRVDAVPTPAANTFFSAYLDPGGKKLVCVAINDDAVERPLLIQPGGFPATSCMAVRTSNTETHARLAPIAITNGSAEVVTAPLSVTTYIFTA